MGRSRNFNRTRHHAVTAVLRTMTLSVTGVLTVVVQRERASFVLKLIDACPTGWGAIVCQATLRLQNSRPWKQFQTKRSLIRLLKRTVQQTLGMQMDRRLMLGTLNLLLLKARMEEPRWQLPFSKARESLPRTFWKF